eukprot:GHVS01028735.1.p1 GENE.GHVS01028735.1~~GHVS01028735.1.p1  ORF type:complete len:576 (+),score=91.44 GHVS01028735.1:1406-3133(+)
MTSAIENIEHTTKQLYELEGKMARLEAEKNAGVEERAALNDNIQLLKEKCNQSMEAHALTQMHLVGSEEEKLRLAKALVALELDNNTLQDKQSHSEFQLAAEKIQQEKEIETANKERKRLLEALEESACLLHKLQDEKSQVKASAATTHEKLARTSERMKSESLKVEDLSMEIVNLVNEKQALEAALNDQSVQLRTQTSELQTLQVGNIKQESDVRSLREQLHERIVNVGRLEAEKQSKQNDLDRIGVEMQNKEIELSRREGAMRDEIADKARQLRKATVLYNEAALKMANAEASEKRTAEETKAMEDELARVRATQAKRLLEIAEDSSKLDSHEQPSAAKLRELMNDVKTYQAAAAEREISHSKDRRKLWGLVRQQQTVIAKLRSIVEEWAPEEQIAEGDVDQIADQYVKASTATESELEDRIKQLSGQVTRNQAEYVEQLADLQKHLQVERQQNGQLKAETLQLHNLKMEVMRARSQYRDDPLQQAMPHDVLARISPEAMEREGLELRRDPRALVKEQVSEIARARGPLSADMQEEILRNKMLEERLQEVEADRAGLIVRATVAEEQASKACL